MKKVSKVMVLPLAGVMSVVSLLPQTTQVSAQTVKEGVVNTHTLTVRSSASSKARIVDYLNKGAKVTIVSDGATWDKVSYGSKTGYVYDDYLNVSTRTVSSGSSAVVATKVVDVNSGRLNIRSSASASARIVGKASDGTKVNVLSYSGSWARVTVGSITGWVHSDYLKDAGSSSSAGSTTGTYVVAKGDTLYGIASKFRTTVSALKSINKLSSTTVFVGQKLTVSGSSTGVVTTPSPNTNSSVLKGKEITIDPGHGGRFAGAHGYVHEEDVNLQIALKVRSELQALGATVYMTRTTDSACTSASGSYTDDLVCRPGVAKKTGSDMFVSIHSNAADSSAYGSESFWYNASRGDKKLAESILKSMTAEAGLKYRFSSYANFSVIRNSGSGIPSTLIETGYVTSSKDAAIIGNSAKQAQIARGIAKGIVNYYN